MTRPWVRRPAALAALGCAAFLAWAAVPGIAQAGLGGAPMATPSGASVADLGHGPLATTSSAARVASQTTSQAAAQTTQPAASSSAAAPYTVRQTTLASGTVVREYLAQDGTVFGVAWSGAQMPDLSALLGDYFTQYRSTVQENRRSGRVRGQGVVRQPGLVVRSGGHMGAFSGVAWLPQALPAGVATSDIK